MAAKSIAGTQVDNKEAFTVATLAGTETISATVLTGQIAIVIDSNVVLTSNQVDNLITRLKDYFRDIEYVTP